MITYLKGTLVEKQPTRVVLEVSGVGYEVLIPVSSFDRLPTTDQECRILTYDYVREDTHQLFGFMTEEERRMFVLLIGASGIGPKLALSVLSGLSVRDITVAVVEGNVKRLSSISGIGKKMAERIVVEVRDKIGKGEALEALSGTEEVSADDRRMGDAVMALIALGHKQSAARKMVLDAVKGGSGEMSVEEIVRTALGG